MPLWLGVEPSGEPRPVNYSSTDCSSASVYWLLSSVSISLDKYFMRKFEGVKPLQQPLPLSFEGEGDRGGEVDK